MTALHRILLGCFVVGLGLSITLSMGFQAFLCWWMGNVAATAPYFHDGSAATLEEAVRRMAAAQLDRTLTDQQLSSIVAFLQTLTGNYRGSPVVGASP